MAETIVVGYDGSENSKRAIDAAVEFAKCIPDAELMIACAQDRPKPGVGFRGLEMGAEEMWDKVVERIEKELAEAAERVRGSGVKAATACTPDAPADTIVRIAHDLKARLIVVGAQGVGYSRDQKTVLGSTTTKVLNEASGIPVLVV